tara:strand:- start:50 stop:193 length:144 start_codon:yes stop_codon:yes gene_type:complete
VFYIIIALSLLGGSWGQANPYFDQTKVPLDPAESSTIETDSGEAVSI